MDDRRRHGGTNSTLRIKEQGMHLTLNEHDDDDEIYNILHATCTYLFDNHYDASPSSTVGTPNTRIYNTCNTTEYYSHCHLVVILHY